MSPTRPLTLAVVLILGTPSLQGCTDCGCQEQYEKCVEEAPPGASKADCANELDECEAACDQGRR